MPTAITKADILASWPKPAPKSIGEPNFASLKELRNYLKAATHEIPTTLGGGQNGHLFLILSDAAYLAHAGQPFVAPVQPAIVPTIPAGATGPQIAEIRAQHEQATATYNTYVNVIAAARQVITESVDAMYLRAIRNPSTFYGHLSPRQLLTFLSQRYGQLYPHEIEAVNNNMKKQWNPNDPFEVVIEQIDDAIDTMDSIQQPYTPQQIITSAYLLVHKTALFNEECKTWRARPVAERTWINFKQQFLEAYRQLRADQTTTAGHLQFGQANIIAQQTADALTSLVNSQHHSEATIQEVQSANAALTKENSNITAQLTATNKALQDLTNLVQQMNTNRFNNNGNRSQRKSNGNYCWTHGFYCGKEHNSASCKNPADGHKKEATASNRMGGSDRGDPNNNK